MAGTASIALSYWDLRGPCQTEAGTSGSRRGWKTIRLGGEQKWGRVEQSGANGGSLGLPHGMTLLEGTALDFWTLNLELPASWQLRAGFPSWAAGENGVVS